MIELTEMQRVAVAGASAAGLAATVWLVIAAFWKKHVQVVTVWSFQLALDYKHGRFVKKLEPGRHRLWGRGHEVIVQDKRARELVVQGQELVTADKATVKLTAVAQFRVTDTLRFTEEAENAEKVLYTLVQLALREVIGAEPIDAVLEKKSAYGQVLRRQVAEGAQALGVEVEFVEVRDVMLGGELKQGYAAVITARQAAQAAVENARGEAAALRTLANAARLFEKNEALFRLRYLKTVEGAAEGSMDNTLVLGVPEEWMGAVKK